MLKRLTAIFFSILLLFTVLFFSCKKDTSTDPLPCSDPGSLEVRVCDILQLNYFGPAEVFLYDSDSARTADVNRTGYKRYTSSSTPGSVGAIFGNLTAKRYYFFARFVSGTKTFTGKGDALVTNCTPTYAICQVN